MIDKPLRHLLHIGPERLVDLSFDGRSLIVTPVDARSKPPRRTAAVQREQASGPVNVVDDDQLTLDEAREAPAVIARLTNEWGMGEESFARLADVKPRLGAYFARVNGGDDRFQGASGAGMRATVRRLGALLQILDEGAPWEHAMVEVLRRSPRLTAG
ncbi:MAG TPA: hypothetical protein VM513_04265 [Kofleriaceae bacterium]|nr:hypothetical protein [Kofleriaceae bacterium]